MGSGAGVWAEEMYTVCMATVPLNQHLDAPGAHGSCGPMMRASPARLKPSTR